MQNNLAKRARVGLVWWVVSIVPLFAHAVTGGATPPIQTAPTEYQTFMSHGMPVSCAVYDSLEGKTTLIFLHGTGAGDVAFGRQQASFFAEHGFRVLLPEYLTVTVTPDPTAANYKRWAQVVEDIVTDLRAHPQPRSRKIVLAGQALGATVALVAGAQRIEVQAIAEWGGLLPNQFFSQTQEMPPLLILHGETDEQTPILNARQLIRLCKLKDFLCEQAIFPNEGHVLSDQVSGAANQRALTFLRTHLQ